MNDKQLVAIHAAKQVQNDKAQSLGLNVIALQQVSTIDLYVDGADEITPTMTLLKGRGYDLVMEKLLAKVANQFIVVADKSKLVNQIGSNFPIPIEVMPFAWQAAKKSIEKIGGKGDLRQNVAKDGLSISSYGSLILDMHFDSDMTENVLNDQLNNIPGVVEHGIFLGLATTVLIADAGKIEEKHF